MPVLRLAHANIRTPDLEETVRFFEAALDLRRGPALTTIDQHRYAWLYDRNGIAVIHVNAPHEDEPPRAAGLENRLDHIAFDCVDPEGFADRLRAAAMLFEVVHSETGGFVQYNLRDPNGIKVELTFAPDQAPALPD
ncbi:VOC family protein [Sphingomonas bacterium]|uniref:VOC family protein n=1 Tax=Sphingomonas bacterium TaxID=1895847 RepID=UPI001575D28E|nr:VOC family protein [Sphingomonas bacterium]